MPGIVLFIPFLIVRFGLLYALNRESLQRAAHFAPMPGKKPVYWVYQISNIALFVVACFVGIKTDPPAIFFSGLFVYVLGLSLLVLSIISFARPSHEGLNRKGMYRFSRNPLYVSYFVVFVGCALLVQSPPLFAVVLIFQVAAHGIILAEEKWCLEQFGEDYLRYQDEVRRYL